MNFKRNLKVLNHFKKEMEKLKIVETSDIKPIIEWVKVRQKKVKSSS